MEHQFVIALSHFDAALYQDLLGRLLHIIPNGGLWLRARARWWT
jgi:hypothetical protein